MSPGFDPDKLISRFPLPKRTKERAGDEEVTEYRGMKYLAVPILGDRIEMRIDGRLILAYDAASDEFSECTGIDCSNIHVTDGIACRYRLMGEWNYSC